MLDQQTDKPASGDYEKAKKTARDGSTRARRRLAQRQDVQAEILYFLAEDPEPEIRRAIAGNPATPVHADLLLARDGDDEVRSDLAAKIGRLAPELSRDDRSRITEITLEIIEILARDQVPRMRQILAEGLAEVTGAPPPVIGKVVKDLALDKVLAVAAPLLERSVLLGDDDLLEIIRGNPPAGALSCIARRHEAGPDVAEAIAASEDTGAVAALLANSSAQIREETLDSIIDAAPGIKVWHEPLVRRPALSAKFARRIAGFVAKALLDVLTAREDLPPETTRAVAKAVRRRLDDAEAKQAKKSKAKPADKKKAKRGNKNDKEEPPLERAKRLHAAGKLDEEAISGAVAAGERDFAHAALAVRSDLGPHIVEEIIASRSAKAVTSLAWKAGLSMRLAMQLQMRLAGIAPNAILNARDGIDYPISADDMNWQIEFFGG